MDDRCKHCICVTCRWQDAGSLCHYNGHGESSSRCSICKINMFQDDTLAAWKMDSSMCKGYEKRYGVDAG